MASSSSSPRPDANAPTSPTATKAAALDSLASCEGVLSAHAFAIPYERDFHFYNSFDPFRCFSKEILSTTNSLLSLLSQADRRASPPEDVDDAVHWLSDFNDDCLEHLDSSLQHVDAERLRLEGAYQKEAKMEEDEGFEVVTHAKAKAKAKTNGGKKKVNYMDEGKIANLLAARVMVKDKKTGEWSARVPFHIPGIPRPQDQFNILVDNTNQPFRHECLDTKPDVTDGTIRYVHPLEKLKVTHLDFVDGNGEAKHLPLEPKSLQDTPFKLVDEVNDLKELAMKLRNVTEFAVDLEHNQYRSFLGLTCLMQISTRTEDFVIDTLKLRIDIGPHLRDIFKDPYKKKIMHGADRDILWLQRDFGIYVCNLFDTGQASRVLNLERHSLEYLLHHYCGISLNKEYQNADWRLRPIPDEMLRYAREDTHHLLYLYDLMRKDLLASTYSENGDALVEVYKRSYDVCLQFYEKELLTDTSYLYIYGLREAKFNCEQLAATAALYEWRDGVARAEDESTGFVLPNKALLEIAKQLPVTRGELHQLVRKKYQFLERQLGLVVNLIKRAIVNAPAFASVLERLEEEKIAAVNTASVESLQAFKKPFGSSGAKETLDPSLSKGSEWVNSSYVQLLKKPSATFGALLGNSSSRQKSKPTSPKKSNPTSPKKSNPTSPKKSNPTSPKKSDRTPSKKPDSASSKGSELDVIEMKLEQMRTAVALPFFSIEKPKECLESPPYQPAKIQESDVLPDAAVLEEIIPLGGQSDDSHQSVEMPGSTNSPKSVEMLESSNSQSMEMPESSNSPKSVEMPESSNNPQSVLVPESSSSPKDSATQMMENLEETKSIEPLSDIEVKCGSPSLDELSSSREKCLENLSQSRGPSSEKVKPWRSQRPLKMESYNDVASKKHVNFGGNRIAGENRSGRKSGRDGKKERKASTHGPSSGEPTGDTIWRPQHPPKVEPYDYAAARKRVDFGGDRVGREEWSDRKSSISGRKERKDPSRGPSSGETTGAGFQQARRRQAFPPSGNRTATFH